MKSPIRHGIIRHPHSGGVQTFLVASGSAVALNVDDGPLVTTIAHHNSNYLNVESLPVDPAWTNLPAGSPCWLYIDLHPLTAQRTFGCSMHPPVTDKSPPVSPVEGQHWFDTTTTTQKEYLNGRWNVVIRLFVAEYDGLSSFTPTGPGTGPEQPYAGSQVGIDEPGSSGKILFKDINVPLRGPRGEFYTTETELFYAGGETNSARQESKTFELKAGQQLPSYRVVKLTDSGTAALAGYLDTNNTIIGMSLNNVLEHDIMSGVIQGIVVNHEWDWINVTGLVPGAPLWIGNDGLLVSDNPHDVDENAYPENHPPVARVIDNISILFQQGLGGRGEEGVPTTTGKPRSVSDEGSVVVSDLDSVNFTGIGVITSATDGTAIVNIPIPVGVNVSENNALVLNKAIDVNIEGTYSTSCGVSSPVNVVNDLDGTVTVNFNIVPPCIGTDPISYQTLATCAGTALPDQYRVLSYDFPTGNVLTCDIDAVHSYIKQPVLKSYSNTQHTVIIPNTTTSIELDTAASTGTNTIFLDIEGSSSDPDLVINSIIGTPPAGNHMKVTVILRGPSNGDTRKVVFNDLGTFMWPTSSSNEFQGITGTSATTPGLIAIIDFNWFGHTIAGEPVWYACPMCLDVSVSAMAPPALIISTSASKYLASVDDGLTWTEHSFVDPISDTPKTIALSTSGKSYLAGESGAILEITGPDVHTFVAPTTLQGTQGFSNGFDNFGRALLYGDSTDVLALSPPDGGLSWSENVIGTGSFTEDVTVIRTPSYYLAYGPTGYLQTSVNGKDWVDKSLSATDDIRGVHVAYNEYGRFVKNRTIGVIADDDMSPTTRYFETIDGDTINTGVLPYSGITEITKRVYQKYMAIDYDTGQTYNGNTIDTLVPGTLLPPTCKWLRQTWRKLQLMVESTGSIYTTNSSGTSWFVTRAGTSGRGKFFDYFPDLDRWCAVEGQNVLYRNDLSNFYSVAFVLPTDTEINDISFIGDNYYMLCSHGYVYRSPDLITWTEVYNVSPAEPLKTSACHGTGDSALPKDRGPRIFFDEFNDTHLIQLSDHTPTDADPGVSWARPINLGRLMYIYDNTVINYQSGNNTALYYIDGLAVPDRFKVTVDWFRIDSGSLYLPSPEIAVDVEIDGAGNLGTWKGITLYESKLFFRSYSFTSLTATDLGEVDVRIDGDRSMDIIHDRTTNVTEVRDSVTSQVYATHNWITPDNGNTTVALAVKNFEPTSWEAWVNAFRVYDLT